MPTREPADWLLRRLIDRLSALPAAPRYLVGLSGGRDSMVLLHSLCAIADTLPGTIEAVHINHGLQAGANEWAEFCQRTCDRWHVHLTQTRIDAEIPGNVSLEAWARERRYSEFAELLGSDDMLLTAHHQGDQVETLLLQLLRGAGPQGLASMPILAKFGVGSHVRPTLDVDERVFAAYAVRHGLEWVEDPSNAELRFDRNYLRHEILPRVVKRWPGAPQTLSRAVALQAQAANLLGVLADHDLKTIRRGNVLDVPALLAVEPARRANSIRHWIANAGVTPPPHRRLIEIINVLCASTATHGLVAWQETEVRRYRDGLHLLRECPEPSNEPIAWVPPAPLPVPTGVLTAIQAGGRGLSRARCRDARMSIRFRAGGECGRLPKRVHRSSLKKLFQSVGVPPWERERIPLVYVDDELAAVAGLWEFAPYRAEPDEQGWELQWQPNYRL